MIGAEREHRVMVWSERHTVTVYQKSRSVWIPAAPRESAQHEA
jgi:hypothetical protein